MGRQPDSSRKSRSSPARPGALERRQSPTDATGAGLLDLPAPAGLRGTRFFIGSDEFAVLSYPLLEDPEIRGLSRAETDVVRGVLRGQSNAEIARERGVSERTIANQLASIYRKLGVSGRAELAHEIAQHDRAK